MLATADSVSLMVLGGGGGGGGEHNLVGLSGFKIFFLKKKQKLFVQKFGTNLAVVSDLNADLMTFFFF